MAPELAYIDYTVFLGMNAASEPLRRRCKSFVVSRLDRTMFMTWDHIGRCDDIIWGYSRELQDLYYPFMDGLHSLGCFRREGYEDSTLRLAMKDGRLQELPVIHRLLVARALEREARVYTLAARLLQKRELPVSALPECEVEGDFPDGLEALYRSSLRLRVPLAGEESGHV